MTLEDGAITGNRAYSGGGVYIQGGVLRQKGGSITGNSAAEGGGIYVKSSDTYEISGTPVVTGNTDEYGDSNNVFLNDNTTITVTGELLDGAKLGISSWSAHTVTSGYADYFDESIPVGQYFVDDRYYHLYFDQNREVAGEFRHDMQLVWTWPEEDDGGQAALEMKCVNCGEAEWSEPAGITGPGEYSEEEGGFEFTAETTHDGEQYSDKRYVAPELVPASEPFIDDDGEYHRGTYAHYVLNFGGNTYYYEVDGNKPGGRPDWSSPDRDLFMIDGETICSYCGELGGSGDEEPIIVLPKTYEQIALKSIGDGSDPFYDERYEGAVTIDVTYMADNDPEVASGAFPGGRDVTVIGPHACHLGYGEHTENNNHYTVTYSDDHVLEAIDDLTEWSDNNDAARIHIQCILESSCYFEVVIEDTVVADELVVDEQGDSRIVYTATGEYNGLEYSVWKYAEPYNVQLNPNGAGGETINVPGSRNYTLPDIDEVDFTPPVGTVLDGWMLMDGTVVKPHTVVTLSEVNIFDAVWRSEWAEVNKALQEGNVVTLLNDITAGEEDTALTVPAGIEASLDFNGHTVDRGLTAPSENGYVLKVDGVLNMSGGSTGVKGLITGGYNLGDGGGIYVAETGNVDITDVDIKSNHSSSGAGIYAAVGGAVVITGCAVMYNIASGKGGGAFVSEGAKLTVKQGSQIIDNVAQEGAGVYIKSGGTSNYSGPNVKVKNNTKPNGDFNNIHPESILNEVPVVIEGSLTGMFLAQEIG